MDQYQHQMESSESSDGWDYVNRSAPVPDTDGHQDPILMASSGYSDGWDWVDGPIPGPDGIK